METGGAAVAIVGIVTSGLSSVADACGTAVAKVGIVASPAGAAVAIVGIVASPAGAAVAKVGIVASPAGAPFAGTVPVCLSTRISPRVRRGRDAM